MEIPKISRRRRRSRLVDDVELGHFTLVIGHFAEDGKEMHKDL